MSCSPVSPKPGQDVRLTIDSGIQIVADNVLAETVRRFHAKGGTAIVENPRTGEIYAMSNVPLVNANRFGESPAHQGNRRSSTATSRVRPSRW